MNSSRSHDKNPHLANLFSSSRRKVAGQVIRKIYLASPASKSMQKKPTCNQPFYVSTNRSTNDMMKEFNMNIKLASSPKHTDRLLFSERKSNEKKTFSIGRKEHTLTMSQSSQFGKTNKLKSSQSGLQKAEQKSTMISTLLSNNGQKAQKYAEDKKKHQEGKNCRVVIIQANEQTQHFVEVSKISDVLAAMRAEYPRVCYFKSVPVQLTLDYLLMQETIPGAFLNGQSLHLKLSGRVTSVDQKEPICLQSFEILKMIGSGGFSKVFLCRFKEDGRFYAMKVIDKDVIVKNKKKKIIMNERNIMKQSDHPFLIDMKFAFQSDKNLVFIMEYCPGGELFGLIKKYKRINEDIARFYIIEIFLGLSYLHQNNVIYRDIKPENILLGQDGHVKIADLGLAKPDMFEGTLAYSFCGSPEYMSPQMIMQVGHSYPVDYYCMGALLYELLIGLPPFYSRDTNQIYEAVLSQELTFPMEIPVSSECKNLLKGLLCKDSKQRLGSIHGVKQILAHPWFGKNAYKKFLQKEVPPPITFDSVGKIDLDRQTEQKHKKQIDDILNAQKHESKRFKPVMKNFYYDFRGITQSVYSNKQNGLSKLKLPRSVSRKQINQDSSASNRFVRKISRQHSQRQLGKTSRR